MKLFEDYMKPKIVKELDVNFTEEELAGKLMEVLDKDIGLAAERYSVNDVVDYKVKTSIQYQISEKYGAGTHLLISNTAMLGVGKAKGTKKRKPVRYCSLEEFKKNGLGVGDVDMSKLMKWLKPFLREKSKQKTIKVVE